LLFDVRLCTRPLLIVRSKFDPPVAVPGQDVKLLRLEACAAYYQR
jgi:hypothetical protein